ncbi:MAG: hypothetical protein SFY92_08260 [Verrucomicrobiae bacterium]|nr:hypothetical protein [Verrucomicrobiae bacterium]
MKTFPHTPLSPCATVACAGLVLFLMTSPVSAEDANTKGFVTLKTRYPASHVKDKVRDPFWNVGFNPKDGDESKPVEAAKPLLPPEAIHITGITGVVGTSNVTVTLNNKYIVDLNEDFDFEYQGNYYSLKILDLNDESATILVNGKDKITASFNR